MRTIVYVDGFNLYYSALKNTSFKWLDLKALCEGILKSHHNITQIKYFTALVSGKFDPHQPIRQQIYIRALTHHIPQFFPIYGKFLSHGVWAPLETPTPSKKMTRIIKTEEKGSDVNLAVHLLHDAWLDLYDCAIVISNDSDLAESMRLVKEHHGKMIGLLCPKDGGHPSKELRKHATFSRIITKKDLGSAQLPSPIPGTRIHKPPSW